MKEVGLLRLDGAQLAMLGAGCAYLQSRLGDMLIQAGLWKHPFEFGQPHCRDEQIPCMDDQLEDFVARADPVSWIKVCQQSLAEEEWEFCGDCKHMWIDQAENMMTDIFTGFCSSMELPDTTGWRELHS